MHVGIDNTTAPLTSPRHLRCSARAPGSAVVHQAHVVRTAARGRAAQHSSRQLHTLPMHVPMPRRPRLSVYVPHGRSPGWHRRSGRRDGTVAGSSNGGGVLQVGLAVVLCGRSWRMASAAALTRAGAVVHGGPAAAVLRAEAVPPGRHPGVARCDLCLLCLLLRPTSFSPPLLLRVRLLLLPAGAATGAAPAATGAAAAAIDGVTGHAGGCENLCSGGVARAGCRHAK